MKRALIIIAKAVLITIIRMMIIKRILIASEYKEGSKDGYYRLY